MIFWYFLEHGILKANFDASWIFDCLDLQAIAVTRCFWEGDLPKANWDAGTFPFFRE